MPENPEEISILRTVGEVLDRFFSFSPTMVREALKDSTSPASAIIRKALEIFDKIYAEFDVKDADHGTDLSPIIGPIMKGIIDEIKKHDGF